jgi:hypothetical protein
MTNYGERDCRRSHWAAAFIALYLVLHQLALSYLATATWLAPGWNDLPSALKWLLGYVDTMQLTPAKLSVFKNVVIAACASGLGGAVYMVRQLYINYAYGDDRRDAKGNLIENPDGTSARKYLQSSEIPRYVLLPFSSVIMGPVLYGLSKMGVLALSGSPSGSTTDVARFTILALCFVLGFAYHDTLAFFSKLSEKILGKSDAKDKAPGKATGDGSPDSQARIAPPGGLSG